MSGTVVEYQVNRAYLRYMLWPHDDIDDHFHEALRRGDTSGDVVFLDEQGNEIKNALSSKTIFDF